MTLLKFESISIRMPHPNRCWCIGLFHSFEYTKQPINYHPMALLPSIASYSSIADLFTKPLSLSRHRFTTTTLIGDLHSPTPSTSVASTVDSVTVVTTVVASAPTVVASSSATTAPTTASALVPTILPFVLDTGAFLSRTPFPTDFCVAQASYGLFRSPISVVSKALTSKALASTPVDPYTLITGEDIPATTVDLSSSDPFALTSDSVETAFDIREFGTTTLTFIYSNLDLIKVFVSPTQVDWIHWVPLPSLTPTESYFHLFGRDYLQAFTLLHLIPIWIYSLLYFVANLE